MTKVTAQIAGQDLIEGEKLSPGQWRLRARGCHRFLNAVKKLLLSEKNPEKWELPSGTSHADLLVKEFILKVKGQWQYPYLQDEICHCRAVPTESVDQAIINGAFTTTRVSRETSASTACGTCRPDVEAIIKLRITN